VSESEQLQESEDADSESEREREGEADSESEGSASDLPHMSWSELSKLMLREMQCVVREFLDEAQAEAAPTSKAELAAWLSEQDIPAAACRAFICQLPAPSARKKRKSVPVPVIQSVCSTSTSRASAEQQKRYRELLAEANEHASHELWEQAGVEVAQAAGALGRQSRKRTRATVVDGVTVFT
jgi:hypothetical protein